MQLLLLDHELVLLKQDLLSLQLLEVLEVNLAPVSEVVDFFVLLSESVDLIVELVGVHVDLHVLRVVQNDGCV